MIYETILQSHLSHIVPHQLLNFNQRRMLPPRPFQAPLAQHSIRQQEVQGHDW